MQARIERNNGDAGVFTLALPSRSEHVITACGRDAGALGRLLHGEAAARNARTLTRFVFAGCRHYADFGSRLSGADGCVSWLQGDACRSGDVSSMQAFAVSGTLPKPVLHNGRLLMLWLVESLQP
jgi:hypothetical protein